MPFWMFRRCRGGACPRPSCKQATVECFSETQQASHDKAQIARCFAALRAPDGVKSTFQSFEHLVARTGVMNHARTEREGTSI